MRIMIIRHGEPNYETGHLTERGVIEAKTLSERLIKEKIDYVYISSLLRAQETAKPYLELSGKSSTTYEWLQEFQMKVDDEVNGGKKLSWDFLPEYFTSIPEIYNNYKFLEAPIFNNKEYLAYYNNVIKEFDALLERHGYKRNGDYYEVVKENKDTIVIFCHLGLGMCLLSRLINVPFPVMAQHFSPLCSSVTTVFTEERRKGIAQFRVSYLGDYSHLTDKGIEPSFYARFKEVDSDDTRSD